MDKALAAAQKQAPYKAMMAAINAAGKRAAKAGGGAGGGGGGGGPKAVRSSYQVGVGVSRSMLLAHAAAAAAAACSYLKQCFDQEQQLSGMDPLCESLPFPAGPQQLMHLQVMSRQPPPRAFPHPKPWIANPSPTPRRSPPWRWRT